MIILKVIYLEYNHAIQSCVKIFFIEFINYMLKGKTLLDHTNVFSPNDF